MIEPQNTSIEDSFEEAINGERPAIVAFFKAFLEGPIYVPDRVQAHPLTDAPEYPSPFTSILGVRDKERTIVPAFTRSELLSAWSENPLTFRKFKGFDLLEVIPAGWWLCINPGSDIDKELSPWELETLKAGESGIEQVAEELTARQNNEVLQIRPLKENEYSSLAKGLIEYAERETQIEEISLLVEEGIDVEENLVLTALVGARLSSGTRSINDIKVELTALSNREQMAGDQVRVFVGDCEQESLFLEAFKGYQPIFCRTVSKLWWKKLFRIG